MNFSRRSLALLLTVLILIKCAPSVEACGPSYIQPIFVFQESPDLPFSEFAAGKLGIVRPQFGRKTLVIAYRYLNDHSFDSAEQQGLVEALKGKPPEDQGDEAVKAWVAARKQFLKEGENLPEIYTERQYGGYDFFPNCTRNAFEVATETLRDRIGSFGADDSNVKTWLVAQDAVFQNCGGGENKLPELGNGSPEWLRKDRAYQVGAALLYSLDFDAARAQFEKIAADYESPWQQTADYLVARTLVRQASFAKDDGDKNRFYERAEDHLQLLLAKGGKLSGATRRMLGLVKYRLRPEERVKELARTLATESGNENLRQDLIDYVWLLDKFEAQAWKEEEKRKHVQQPGEPEPEQSPGKFIETLEAQLHGDTIDISLEQKPPDATSGSPEWTTITFRFDVSEDEILQTFEVRLNKKLTAAEIVQLHERHAAALAERKWRLSPNQKWNSVDHEGGYGGEGKLSTDVLQAFLRTDEMTDWIFTFQSDDAPAYWHALSRWRATGSGIWLLAALSKAEPGSPAVDRLLRAAERTNRDQPIFASLAFHRVRLQLALGRKTEARKLLDDVISWQEGILPVSAQNQFLEQRLALAGSLSEFLKFAPRRPVTFYDEGKYGSLKDLFEVQKNSWSSDYSDQSQTDYEKQIDDEFRDTLVWDDRLILDDRTVEILNWHFPLQILRDAARDPALPDYLRRQVMLAVWTRAVLLRKDDFAQEVSADIIGLAPDLAQLFQSYAKARTPGERQAAAIYTLLKQPSLSPFIAGGLPVTSTAEQLDYWFETSWWCPPSETDYDFNGNEIPKVVSKPGFLTAAQAATAARERAQLIATGDGKSYLGRRVLEWAKSSPADERLPEALFIAARANGQYKYGCNSWEFDSDTKRKLEALLRERYPNSSWAMKLKLPSE